MDAISETKGLAMMMEKWTRDAVPDVSFDQRHPLLIPLVGAINN